MKVPKTNKVHQKYSFKAPFAFKEKFLTSDEYLPLKKQFLPHEDEINEQIQKFGLYDPIGDHHKMQTSMLIHRYENRALFFPTKLCPIHCRYCFRKNELNNTDETLFRQDWEKTYQYLKKHSKIDEIIFSGGDPLVLSNQKLQTYLDEFSKLKHIKIIRFHTRMPMISPERLNEDFCHLLKNNALKFKKILLAIHTNHASEFSPEVITCLKQIKKLCPEIKLLSQSVLLRGVNDNATDLGHLFLKFEEVGITPYYLHHPDKVKGAMHFYLGEEEGHKIFQEVRQKLSGWLLPRYVIDSDSGMGKKQIS